MGRKRKAVKAGGYTDWQTAVRIGRRYGKKAMDRFVELYSQNHDKWRNGRRNTHYMNMVLAFPWGNTKEGYTYWSTMAMEIDDPVRYDGYIDIDGLV